MKKLLVILTIIFAILSFSEVTNITYYTTDENVVVLIELNHQIQPSKVNFGWNESETVYFLELKDNYISNSFIPVSKGPLEGIQVINTTNGINMFFFTILPTKIDWYVLNNKVFVNIPITISSKRVTYSFVNAPLDVVIRDLAETVGIDVSVYQGARNKTVNLVVSNTTVEDAFRQLFLNNPEISYAFSPEKRLYVGTPEEISANFAKYWYIYDGEVNADKIKVLLGSGTFINYLKDKAKIFVYGGVREHRMIADAISTTPTESWHYFGYEIDEKTLESFLNKISNVYDFKFVILDALKQVAIYSNNDVANTLGYFLTVLKTEDMLIEQSMEKVKVRYPERIKNVLDKVGIKNNIIGEYVEVPKKYVPLVYQLNDDRTVGNPYRLVFEDVYKETIQNALTYLNISPENGKVTEQNGKVFVTLFVNEELYKRFMQFADIASTKVIKVQIDKNLIKNYDVKIINEDEFGLMVEGKEKIIDEIKKLEEEYKKALAAKKAEETKKSTVKYTLNLLPTDPSIEVFEALLDVTPVYYTDKYAVFELNKDEVDSFEDKIKMIRSEFGKKIKYLSGYIVDDNLKNLVKEIYDVDVIEISNGYLFTGINVNDAIKFVSNYARTKEDIKIVTKSLEIDLENSDEVVTILKEIYDIDSIYFPGIKVLYMKGKNESVENAEKFVVSLKNKQSDEQLKFKVLELTTTEQLKNILSEIAGLQVYTYQDKTILYGSEISINKAEEIIQNVISESIIKRVETNIDYEKVEKFVKFLYGDKVSVINIGNSIYFKGPKIYVDEIVSQLDLLDTTASIEQEQNENILVSDNKIYIEVKDYLIDDLINQVFNQFKKTLVFNETIGKKVTLNLVGITFDDFIKILDNFGIEVLEKNNIYYIELKKTADISVSNGKIYVNVTDARIADVVQKVYGALGYSVIIDGVDGKISLRLEGVTLEDFEKVLSDKVTIEKEQNFVYVSTKKVEQVQPEETLENALVEYKNGLFTIDAENVSLSLLIREVMKKIGYSAIISKNIETISNIYAKDITFDNFINILNNYNISVDMKDDIYFFNETTVEATQNVDKFVFSVPRGSEKIRELVAFYGGQSFVDTESGMVIATGISAKSAAEIREYINNLLAVKLALIEVKVIDEDINNSLEVDLGKITTEIGELSNNGVSINLALSDLSFEKIAEKIFGSNTNIEFADSLSNTIGNSNIVAEPNVVAKSGETANIVIGDRLPIILTDSEGNETIQYLQSGVILEITPFINADNTIDLKLRIEVSTFDWELGSTTVSKLPVEKTREFTSSLTLKDGQTLIIGGLTRDEKITTVNKLPILGDLPIIGKFFSKQVDKVTKRNLIIFITAKVVE
ncbi:MAG: type II and III secretion system protein [Thermosipho sp. (in: Bacteria)]|nr:type II and III secretion system protein [Thermosipho sp. (in: thermotogales)]